MNATTARLLFCTAYGGIEYFRMRVPDLEEPARVMTS
jgi:hypothetical protein